MLHIQEAITLLHKGVAIIVRLKRGSRHFVLYFVKMTYWSLLLL